MNDNRTPSLGRAPYYARPRRSLNETVTSVRAAADVPDGYTQDVVLALVMDEPRKAGSNPPRREIRTRLHTDDSFSLGVRLITESVDIERRNRQDGAGGQRPHAFDHPAGEPERLMHKSFARENEALVRVVLERLTRWQEQHPNVADYRVTGSMRALREATRFLDYLTQDTTPDLDKARAALGAFDDEDTRPPGERTLTGHPEVDARNTGKEQPE